MVQPMLGFLGSGFIVIIFFFGVIVLGILGILMLFCIRKVPLGKAGVRVGLGGYVISDTWLFCIPLVTRFELMDISVQKLKIERKGRDGIFCKDNIRADTVVAFHLKVNYPKMDHLAGDDPDSLKGRDTAKMSGNQAKYEDVLKVAQTVGCERAADPEKLRELFEGRFSEALKTAAKGMEFQTLHDERLAFREKIIVAIGEDLYGYALEDVVIDYLEQTPIEHLDPNNVLDAQGIKKIKMMQAAEREATDERKILDDTDSLREEAKD